MAAKLNHTIVWSRDPQSSANYLAEMLGLPEPRTFGPFQVVEVDNGVSLDFASTDSEPAAQHYAFLVTEAEFDEIFGRITERGVEHWADPGRRKADSINTHDGGRGVYFPDPDGHLLEIITRPYGG